MKLWRKEGWRKMENERAFLARVAWRVAVDKRRAAALPCEPMEAGDAPSPDPGPESTLVEKSSVAMVHRMLNRLPACGFALSGPYKGRGDVGDPALRQNRWECRC